MCRDVASGIVSATADCGKTHFRDRSRAFFFWRQAPRAAAPFRRAAAKAIFTFPLRPDRVEKEKNVDGHGCFRKFAGASRVVFSQQ
jgi:hypothetical protein